MISIDPSPHHDRAAFSYHSHCHIEALLDNRRSAYNVGSMFRSADGCGLRHMHLCGFTPNPEHIRVAKTSLGAEFSVPWTSHPDAQSVVRWKKDQGYHIMALEESQHSISIFDSLTTVNIYPTLFIVGNEVSGVDPAIEKFCDRCVFIPMLGYKRSLNVATAFCIAAYLLCFANTVQQNTLQPNQTCFREK